MKKKSPTTLWENRENKILASSFLLLESQKESENFLRDLLTENEIIEFSKRLQVAFLLSKKKSYKDIEQITSLSSTTIARISKWLSQNNGGYQNILKKLDHKHVHRTEFFDEKSKS